MRQDHSLATQVHTYRRADDARSLQQAIAEVVLGESTVNAGSQRCGRVGFCAARRAAQRRGHVGVGGPDAIEQSARCRQGRGGRTGRIENGLRHSGRNRSQVHDFQPAFLLLWTRLRCRRAAGGDHAAVGQETPVGDRRGQAEECVLFAYFREQQREKILLFADTTSVRASEPGHVLFAERTTTKRTVRGANNDWCSRRAWEGGRVQREIARG